MDQRINYDDADRLLAVIDYSEDAQRTETQKHKDLSKTYASY